MTRAHAVFPRGPGGRAVLLFLPGVDRGKQERLFLEWVARHCYAVTSLAGQPAAAIALAEAGLVDVIVVPTHTRATTALAARAALAGVQVDEIRPGQATTSPASTTAARIVDAARRGAPVDAIAAVLDVPLATVREVLGMPMAGLRPAAVHAGTRPRVLTLRARQ